MALHKGNELAKKRAEDGNKIHARETLEEILLADSKSNEVWKDIPSFEGLYQASNLGRIRQLPFIYRNKNGKLIYRKYLLPKQSYVRGYTITYLRDLDGELHGKGTHRWVMLAFVGDSELQVDHINGVRDDNRLENLRYLNSSDNVNHVKTLNPERYTSDLHGVHANKNKWVSRFKINGISYHLGVFDIENEAYRAYKTAKFNWEELGILPEKIRCKKFTSRNKGLGFHKLSGKWRVRVNGIYFGLFETEAIALRVYNIANFLHSRRRLLDKELVTKIKKKYTNDERYDNIYLHLQTGFETQSGGEMASHLGVPFSTFHTWKRLGRLEDKGILMKTK